MANKSGASLQKKAQPAEEAPAELFIPATDHGKVAQKTTTAKAKPKPAKAADKTEHTQMDIEDYLRVLRTLGVQDDKRENFFGRLIVRAFEHRLVNPHEAIKDDHQLSRSVLPGFFTVLHILLGRSLIERYQEMTKEIIKRANGSLENIDWNKIYGDKDAQHVALDALVALALHLESIDESATWFVDLVNDHSGASEKISAQDLLSLQLTQSTFQWLLKDLFADLSEVLSSETGRLQMTKRHGAETCIKLVEFMDQLT
ncbi:MAG: hypothetical protein VW802_06550 [Rhodospirillaceae bacterium]|jgi:hypothetical protein